MRFSSCCQMQTRMIPSAQPGVSRTFSHIQTTGRMALLDVMGCNGSKKFARPSLVACGKIVPSSCYIAISSKLELTMLTSLHATPTLNRNGDVI